jgi:integrase
MVTSNYTPPDPLDEGPYSSFAWFAMAGNVAGSKMTAPDLSGHRPRERVTWVRPRTGRQGVIMARKRRGRGEGSVYREGDGRWAAVASLGYDGHGKRRRVKVRADTKAEAQRLLQEALRKGVPPDASNLTVADFIRLWLDGRHASGSLGDTSYARLGSLIDNHLRDYWQRTRLGTLKAAHVEMFFQHLRAEKVALPTQAFVYRILNSALADAVRKELLHANPCRTVAVPRCRPREMKIFDEAQCKQLLDAARGHELFALFCLAVGSGMRIGELLALQWADVDLEAGTVEVRATVARVQRQLVLKAPKTRAARRKIVLPAYAVEALRQHRGRQGDASLLGHAVFCTPAGRLRYAHGVAHRLFRALLAKAGLPRVRFHDLRHSHASILLSRGCSLRAVAARLGHSKPELTLRVYSHCLPGDDTVLAGVADLAFRP